MAMNNLLKLPECLIPFIAQKVRTKLLWNNGLGQHQLQELQNAAGYIIEEQQQYSIYDNNAPLLADEKVFYAERYGGDAISRHGGGARCGFDGHWQVKGIGANALVGRGSKQVDGELTLTGFLLELPVIFNYSGYSKLINKYN